MIFLGIESSCDETAAAVVRGGGEVLSSVVSSQFDLHREYAGVVPEIASRAHVESILPVVREALEQAGVGLGWIDAVAVGNRPGLIGSLLVGVSAAKALAWSLGKPLIGVDHVQAHLYSGVLARRDGETERRRDGVSDGGNFVSSSLRDSVSFPALGLVVSGGHTSIYLLRSWTELTRLGGTIDDAVGEAYDKVAAILGVPYPGGPNLDKLAQPPGADDRAFEFPVSRLGRESLDFSFSGLKTAVLYAARGVPGGDAAPALTAERKRDIAASFQRAAAGAVLLKLTRAHEAHPQVKTLLTGGGVTANSRLRGELERWGAARGVRVFLPRREYCIDNAAMIAGLGAELFSAGRVNDLSLQALPTTAC